MISVFIYSLICIGIVIFIYKVSISAEKQRSIDFKHLDLSELDPKENAKEFKNQQKKMME